MSARRRTIFALAAGVAGLAAAVGCGLGITSPDLFLLTRTGPGSSTNLLINDGGSIRCNDRAPRPLAEPLLLRARDLATALAPDARARLNLPSSANSVYRYKIKLPSGTVAFPDTAAGNHPELARALQFAVQVAQQGCGLKG